MSKFKTMVKNDIQLCNEYIKKGYASQTDVKSLIGKYIMDYPSFRDGIINYVRISNDVNEIENIKIIKSKLEYILNRCDNPDLYNKKISETSISPVNGNSNSNQINISTINNNSNQINVNLSISEIRNIVDDNTYLSDSEKEELLLKLDEIEKLQYSKESKSKKWNKAKSILGFIMDKGADIAIMYIPQIIKAINN